MKVKSKEDSNEIIFSEKELILIERAKTYITVCIIAQPRRMGWVFVFCERKIDIESASNPFTNPGNEV